MLVAYVSRMTSLDVWQQRRVALCRENLKEIADLVTPTHCCAGTESSSRLGGILRYYYWEAA